MTAAPTLYHRTLKFIGGQIAVIMEVALGAKFGFVRGYLIGLGIASLILFGAWVQRNEAKTKAGIQ